MKKICRILESAESVCLVIDIWTKNSRSFLGCYCTFVNEAKLAKVFLGMREFPGERRIIHVLQHVDDFVRTYGLQQKKISVLTDGGTNMIDLKKPAVADSKTKTADLNQPMEIMSDDESPVLKRPYVQYRCIEHLFQNVVHALSIHKKNA